MSDDDSLLSVLGTVAVLLIMRRLDRLGEQLEAVCVNIQIDVAHRDERKRELQRRVEREPR